MIAWLDAHVGLAVWLALAVAAAITAVRLLSARRRRMLGDRAQVCAVLHPIRALTEAARSLREAMEQGDGERLREVETLVDGALAQRLRDVRGLAAQGLPSPAAIEAVYTAKEAAARLLVWLERTRASPAERRLSIQLIWKSLHDATGLLERDLAALEGGNGRSKRRF